MLQKYKHFPKMPNKAQKKCPIHRTTRTKPPRGWQVISAGMAREEVMLHFPSGESA